jgi:hypothetical protein
MLFNYSLDVILVFAQLLQCLFLGCTKLFGLRLQGEYTNFKGLRLLTYEGGQVCVQGLLQLDQTLS